MSEHIVGPQVLITRMRDIIRACLEGDNPPFGLVQFVDGETSDTIITYPNHPARRMDVDIRDVWFGRESCAEQRKVMRGNSLFMNSCDDAPAAVRDRSHCRPMLELALLRGYDTWIGFEDTSLPNGRQAHNNAELVASAWEYARQIALDGRKQDER